MHYLNQDPKEEFTHLKPQQTISFHVRVMKNSYKRMTANGDMSSFVKRANISLTGTSIGKPLMGLS